MSPRERAALHMRRLLGASTLGLASCGYAVVDPMPVPAQTEPVTPGTIPEVGDPTPPTPDPTPVPDRDPGYAVVDPMPMPARCTVYSDEELAGHLSVSWTERPEAVEVRVQVRRVEALELQSKVAVDGHPNALASATYGELTFQVPPTAASAALHLQGTCDGRTVRFKVTRDPASQRAIVTPE